MMIIRETQALQKSGLRPVQHRKREKLSDAGSMGLNLAFHPLGVSTGTVRGVPVVTSQRVLHCLRHDNKTTR